MTDRNDRDGSDRAESEPIRSDTDDPDPGIDALVDDEPSEVVLEDDPFEAMDVDVGETDVWAALETDDPGVAEQEPETITASETATSSQQPSDVAAAGQAGGAEWGSEDEYDDRIVEKREYCQRCPHSTDPPTLACTHDGTAIVEVVEMDRFRVRNCPMVSADGPTFDRVNE
jgi:hypothetical protein